MPLPNEMCWEALARWMSNVSGSSNSVGLAVGRGEVHEDLGAGRDVVPGKRRRLGGDPAPRDLTRLEPQHLLDGVGDQRRVGDELAPLVAPRQEAHQAVADQVGDGLVTGEREAVDDRLDLAIREVVGVGVVGVEELRCEIIVTCVTFGCREVAAVAPVGEHLLGDLGLFGRRRLAPRERLAVAAPVLERLVVAVGEPDEPEHRLTGQRERERVDELDRWPLSEHGIDQLVAAAAHVRLERLEPASGEALAGVHPDAGVVGLGPVRHHRDRIEVGRREHFGRPFAQREHRILDVGRRVDVGIPEDGVDVLHARDDEVAELGRRRTPASRRAGAPRSSTGHAGSRRRADSTCGAPGNREVGRAPRPGSGGSCWRASSR